MAREFRANRATPSREEFREPRHGRVAWLTAVSRLQWRDRGRIARPSPLPLPAICRESVCRELRRVNAANDSSRRACVSALEPGDLLANLRGDTIRSGKFP